MRPPLISGGNAATTGAAGAGDTGFNEAPADQRGKFSAAC